MTSDRGLDLLGALKEIDAMPHYAEVRPEWVSGLHARYTRALDIARAAISAHEARPSAVTDETPREILGKTEREFMQAGNFVWADIALEAMRRVALSASAPLTLASADEAIEQAAKAIFAHWKFKSPVEWVNGGNSEKQDEARRYARAALETVALSASVDRDGVLEEGMRERMLRHFMAHRGLILSEVEGDPSKLCPTEELPELRDINDFIRALKSPPTSKNEA